MNEAAHTLLSEFRKALEAKLPGAGLSRTSQAACVRPLDGYEGPTLAIATGAALVHVEASVHHATLSTPFAMAAWACRGEGEIGACPRGCPQRRYVAVRSDREDDVIVAMFGYVMAWLTVFDTESDDD